MNDGPALLRAILERPDDDAPRLVYADWLDEQGGANAAAQAARIRREVSRPEADWRSNIGPGLVGDPVPGWEAVYRRGFAERVELPIADFRAHAHALFAAHPIVAVRLTDAEAAGPISAEMFRALPVYWECGEWIPTERWYLPECLFELLGGYGATGQRGTDVNPRNGHQKFFRTLDDAYASLSAACVAHGRRLVGLPPLG